MGSRKGSQRKLRKRRHLCWTLKDENSLSRECEEGYRQSQQHSFFLSGIFFGGVGEWEKGIRQNSIYSSFEYF